MTLNEKTLVPLVEDLREQLSISIARARAAEARLAAIEVLLDRRMMRSEKDALRVLSEAGECWAAEVGQALGRPLPRAIESHSRPLSMLVARGYVSRRDVFGPDLTSRTYYMITDEGRCAIEQIQRSRQRPTAQSSA